MCHGPMTITSAMHVAARPAAHQQHLSCMSLPALALGSATCRCPPAVHQHHHSCAVLRAQQLTASPRLPPGWASVHAVAHRRPSATRRCAPCSSQLRLGYIYDVLLPASQLTAASRPAAPQLHVARPAAHSSRLGYMTPRSSPAQCCAPSSSRPRLGCIPATLRCPLSSQTCLGC